MTDKLREAAQQALEALEHIEHWYMSLPKPGLDSITALRAALAEQPAEQEPVAWMTYESKHRLSNGGNCKGAVPVHKNPSHASCVPLYTAPQPAKQPLTREQALAVAAAIRAMKEKT